MTDNKTRCPDCGTPMDEYACPSHGLYELRRAPRDGQRSVDLWYPRADGPTTVDSIRVSLMSVRAADDIVIRYDFDRDGYTVSMERTDPRRGEACEGLGIEDEIAFIPAWNEPGDKFDGQHD